MTEKIFEPLKNVKTLDELPQALQAAESALKDAIFHEKQNSHQSARVQLYETIKSQIAQMLPDVFADIDVSKTRYEDMLGRIAEVLKKPRKEKHEEQKSETPEQIKARLESEYKKLLEEERQKLAFERAFSEIEASAIAKKLDSAYKKIFSAALRSEVIPELAGDKIVFKSPDGQYYTRDGQYATAEQVAEELLKRYPKFVADAPKTPTPQNAVGQQNLIRAGLAELKIFR
ncbi:MAG: hypothetical protein ONA90_07520 [candidate division KSB1 bacterium]|nr:hypothetical protein [candidate division KSB1 bacterium]